MFAGFGFRVARRICVLENQIDQSGLGLYWFGGSGRFGLFGRVGLKPRVLLLSALHGSGHDIPG